MLTIAAGALQAGPPLARIDSFRLQALHAQKHERVKRIDPAIQTFLGREKQKLGHELRRRDVDVDPYGRTFARYEHYFQGLRIDGPEVVGTLTQDDRLEPVAYAFRNLLQPEDGVLKPGRGIGEARKIAGASAGAVVETVLEPILERVQWQGGPVRLLPPWLGDAAYSYRVLKGWRQVHKVFHPAQRGMGQKVSRVDAHSGELLSSGANVSCSPGTGNSQYSGQVSLSTSGGTNILVSGTGGNYGVYGPDGSTYSSANAWFGDGADYLASNGPSSVNGATAAVDVLHGLDLSYTFYQRMFGRNHFDGSNAYHAPAYIHVDGLSNPAAAYWNNNWPFAENYWISFRNHTFGSSGSPTELSVVAHEWTHLINFRAARVGREGGDAIQYKAVNEASSTILGTAACLWRSTGASWGIGYPDPSNWKTDWSYQPQVMPYSPTADPAPGVQVLFRPSYSMRRDPSWWTAAKSGWGDQYSWGAPLLRFFYFAANGAQPVVNPDDPSDEQRGRTSPLMPWGFAGMGAHNAAVLYYHAFTQKFNRTTDVLGAGSALGLAAAELFGAGSEGHKATLNALGAVGLGAPWIHAFAAWESNHVPGSASPLPTGEHAGTASASLSPGDGSRYYRVLLPARGGLNLYVNSVVPFGEEGTAVSLQVLSSDGSTVLAFAAAAPEPSMPPILTVDEGGFTPPDPAPPGEVYMNAALSLPNNTSLPREVLVRVLSSSNRTTDVNFNLTMRVFMPEFLQPIAAERFW